MISVSDITYYQGPANSISICQRTPLAQITSDLPGFAMAQINTKCRVFEKNQEERKICLKNKIRL